MQDRRQITCLHQANKGLRMPSMSEDWMFGITSGTEPPTSADYVQGSAPLVGTTLHSDPAAAKQWSEAGLGSKAGTISAESPVHVEAHDSRQAQDGSQEGSPLAAPALARPAADVPASVKEAVVRFETWTLAQSLPMVPASMSDAPASQQAALNQGQPPAWPQPWSSSAAQHQHQQGFDQQQLKHDSPPSLQLQQQKQQQQQQQQQQLVPQAAEQALRHQSLPSQTAGLSTEASLCQHLQEVPAYQPQSTASTFIQATLAAINADHSVASAQHADEPAGRSALPLQAAVAEHPFWTVASGAFVAAVSSGEESSAQRPPLPGKRAGQVFLTRPGFADGFANPALYQQPWLQGAASNGGVEASHHTSRTPAAQRGSKGSGSPPLPLFHRHSKAHDDLRSSDDPLSASTTALTGSTPPPFSSHDVSWPMGTDANRGTSLRADAGRRLPTDTTAAVEGSQHPGRTAGRALDEAELPKAEDELSRRGRDEENAGARSSKWSAVNAYRQAREAAAKPAAGDTLCELSCPQPAAAGKATQHVSVLEASHMSYKCTIALEHWSFGNQPG